MKQGMDSIVAMAEEILRQADRKEDFIADTRSLRLRANGALRLDMLNDAGDEQLTLDVSDAAARQMGEKVGIPAKYFDKMKDRAPELLSANVNHWFTNAPKAQLVRTWKGGFVADDSIDTINGTMRAFLSDKYQRIDNIDVATTVLPVLLDKAKGLDIVSCDITENKMYIKAVLPSMQSDVKVGDTVQAGVWITNSEIGKGMFEVAPFIYRLVCLNGQKVNDARFGRRHLGSRTDVSDNTFRVLSDETLKADDHAFLLKARDVVSAAFDERLFESNVNKLRDTTERKIEGNPVKAIEVLGKSCGLLQHEQSGVLRNLIEGADLSQYGLIQSVTAYSQEVNTYDRASELEELGGKLVDLSPREWQTIAVAA